MKRLRLNQSVCLPDDTIAKIEDCLESGTLVRETVWCAQHDETHGNILGLAPRWKTERSWLKEAGDAVRYARINGLGARLITLVRVV